MASGGAGPVRSSGPVCAQMEGVVWPQAVQVPAGHRDTSLADQEEVSAAREEVSGEGRTLTRSQNDSMLSPRIRDQSVSGAVSRSLFLCPCF